MACVCFIISLYIVREILLPAKATTEVLLVHVQGGVSRHRHPLLIRVNTSHTSIREWLMTSLNVYLHNLAHCSVLPTSMRIWMSFLTCTGSVFTTPWTSFWCSFPRVPFARLVTHLTYFSFRLQLFFSLSLTHRQHLTAQLNESISCQRNSRSTPSAAVTRCWTSTHSEPSGRHSDLVNNPPNDCNTMFDLHDVTTAKRIDRRASQILGSQLSRHQHRSASR